METLRDRFNFDANPTLNTDSAARTIAGSFRLVQRLKQGAGHEVHLGHDINTGQAVIVRTTSAAIAATVQMRLEHEAAIFTKLQSASLTGLLDFGRHEDQFYWARPFVHGGSLENASTEQRSLQHALAIGRSLFAGLQALHHQG